MKQSRITQELDHHQTLLIGVDLGDALTTRVSNAVLRGMSNMLARTISHYSPRAGLGSLAFGTYTGYNTYTSNQNK